MNLSLEDISNIDPIRFSWRTVCQLSRLKLTFDS
jgi:hypothetical protein